ncbi:MAG TPA: hypothetical protein VI168_14795 [Croceibacterium sp.]
MPDAYGNLLSQSEFADDVCVRLHSYLDSENLVLALALDGAFIHNLANGPLIDNTVFTCGQVDGGFVLSLQQAEFGGPRMNWYPWDKPQFLLIENDFGGYYQSQFVFTVDMVQGPWFALNNYDHSRVADVKESATAEGSAVIAWGWNGGANQIWRAQIFS